MPQLPAVLIHVSEGETFASLLSSDFWNILLYGEPNIVVLELPLTGPGLPSYALVAHVCSTLLLPPPI